MTTQQQERAKALFVKAQEVMWAIKTLVGELTGPTADRLDSDYRDALRSAQSAASECRLHLLDAYPKQETHCPTCHEPRSEFGDCALCRPRY